MSNRNYFPLAWCTTALVIAATLVYCFYCMKVMAPKYMMQQTNATWFEALQNCTDQGRQLVTFGDADEVLDLSLYLCNQGLNQRRIWLGRVAQNNITGDWRKDFASVYTGATFPHFHSNIQLFNSTIQDRDYEGHCLLATYSKNPREDRPRFTLIAADCNSTSYFVCQKSRF